MTDRDDMQHRFAEFVSKCRYEDLSPEAIDGAKKSILDTLGVMLAATGSTPAVGAVAEVVREAGGTPEASILGFGGRTSAVMAAFANGAMAHCLDFDDHAPEGHHYSSSIVPAAFALAERAGGVSGTHMITAVAAAQDMFLRMRRNVESRLDWHLTTVLGVFSATAAAAHILRLDTQRTIDAFGIAGMSSCGTLELAYGVGTDLRGLYAGFPAKGAVLAALMAEKGVRGVRSMFEGKAGLFNTYFGGKYDRAKMLDGLGRTFSGGSTLYKPYPSCGASHGLIHSTIGLMKESRLAIADVEEIRVHVGDFQYQLCQPLEGRRAPKTAPDAKFSIPFCIAVAATRGEVRIRDFLEANLADPAVLAAARKVVPVLDTGHDWKMKLPKGRMEILMRDGRRFERECDVVPGDAESPMDWNYLDAKFADCASLSATPIPGERIRAAQEKCRGLESLTDATEVMRLFGA